MNISRKEFLKKTALLTGSLVLLPAAGSLAGCSAPANEPERVNVSADGIIKYNITGRLKNPGEGELLELDIGSKIILIKKDSNNFTALNPVCTHKGCELIKKKDFLDCPCHGSEFDFAGKVLKGPADEPLASFRTEFDGKNTVTIFLK